MVKEQMAFNIDMIVDKSTWEVLRSDRADDRKEALKLIFKGTNFVQL
jgi:hypothetical protein